VKTTTLIVMLLTVGGSLHAQETTPSSTPAADNLSLEAAIGEGMSRSPEVQRAQAAKSESEWHRFETMGAGFLPKLELDAHHYFSEKYTNTAINFGQETLSFPGFYPTDVAALELSIPVFDGLSSYRSLQAAKLLEAAANAELSQTEFQLRQDIRLAFYKSLAAQQLQAVAEQNVKTLDDHLKQVDAQKSGGVATRYDVLRVQVQLSEAKADLMDAQDNYTTARKRLIQLMGMEDDNRILVGELPVPEAKVIKDLAFTQVPAERADIAALNLRAEAANRTRQASEAWMVPSISLGGEYMWYQSQYFNNTVEDTGKYPNAYNIGVFLKWNLFDGGVAYARQKEASFKAVEAEKVARSSKLQVPYDFEFWKRRYLSNTDHYISKKFDITRSEESVRLAKEEERAGTRTSTETLDAELDLFRAKAGVVNALVNAAEAKIRLELALGREI
jgi:outer membrane protein TolC